MKLPPLYPKKAALVTVAGALLALAVLPGCKKAAPPPPPPPVKPAAGVTASGTNTAAVTNLATEFLSVFDASLPPGNAGKDPFNPDSIVRFPATVTPKPPVGPAGPTDPQLKLLSVTGSPGRWWAVINSQILTIGEEVTMKVPGGTVKLKVADIGPDYAVVIVDGTQKRLTMGQKK